MLNTFIFAIPAHWIWAIVDIAGAGPVHLVGGLSGLIATLMLKPRYERFKSNVVPLMGSPTNAILGMLCYGIFSILCVFHSRWGFLGFACGSTFGISGLKWKLAARSAVAAVCTSISGGIVGLTLSYIVNNRKFDIAYMINGILAICVLVQPVEAIIIGVVGALISEGTVAILNKLHIDDPVGCIGIHACSGTWSLLAAGIFVKKDILAGAINLETVDDGLFKSGRLRQLGIQCLAVLAISVWTIITGFLFLKLIDLTIGLRVPLGEEILGADIVEHSVTGVIYDKKTKQIIHQSGTDDGTLNRGNIKNLDLLKDQKKNRKYSHSLDYHVEDEDIRSRDINLFKDIKNVEKNCSSRKKLDDICMFCLCKIPCVCCSKPNKEIDNIDHTTPDLDLNENKNMSICNANIPKKLLRRNNSNCDKIHANEAYHDLHM
ncbi:hypothetical protein KUTeg_018568 [Tegillarca granosa]|uniref:Ammonium transporter AmtB-like domain-containing protein n=1 Tax=Tegillarca granosa TaxID=220873 RepID=A0ABQ9EIH8_TEGGR|nr:hypothetical protein KUTeg_018568 [Tegillarca granosa]